ncbi:MAG TPA: hypothetical protein PK504_13110 [Ferruginibacter sp.]|nr:hypothetical protein [Ferruginibacter sp.]HRE64519.1 hypothetical protein [Ferruginibacter sp.]
MNTLKPIQKILSILLLLMLCIPSANSQAVKTYIDRNNILIGEPIRVDITVGLSSSVYNVDFGIPDSIAHFEFIQKEKRDTTENGVYTLKQSLVFTSFDSGQWLLPSFPITISNENKQQQSFLSDSVIIKVGYSPADSTNALRDIKPVMDVFVIDRTWLYYLAAAITALILFIIIYRYFKNRKKKTPPIFNTRLSAYDEAIQAFAALEKDMATDAKIYHGSISNIFKRYYSRKTNYNLMPDTTGDILMRLKTHAPSDVVSLVAEVMRLGDAVKFAKFNPSANENIQCIQGMKLVIEQLEKNKR